MESRNGESRNGERSDEARRLAALRRYDVLDTPPEASFDRLTRLASGYFDVPIALVSFVDAERQWFKSCYGFDRRETGRALSFCHYAVTSGETVVVEDATEDERFSENPLVTGAEHIRFYAGAPLMTPDGHALGTLCVLDAAPRAFGEEDVARLEDFAAAAMDALEQRRRTAASREAEAARRAAERETRSLLESITEAFFALDEEWRFTYVNDEAERVLERRREDLLGRSVWKEFPEAVGSTFYEAYHRAVREQTDVQFEEYYLPLDRWFEVHAYPRAGEDGGVAVFFNDVNARKKAEARFRSVVENARDVIFQTDAEGRFTLLSPSWEKVSGYTVEESLGDRYTEYGLPGAEPEAVDPYRRRVADREDHLTDQVRLQTKTGEARWLRVRARLLRGGEGGAVTGTVGTLSDVTDSLQLKAAQEARERAEELLAAKTALLNNMSHELRTPLAAINGFAEVLAEEGEGEQQEFAERIARGGERLRVTLESVLSLAQLEGGGGPELDLQPTDVAAAVREAAAPHRRAAEERGLSFAVRAAPEADDARASLDGDALRRVLDHLLSNAVKFTEEGAVAVRVAASARQVSVGVEDSGIGIGEEFRKSGKLFEDFEQESKGLSRTHEGSGVGLAVARRLVEAMDGSIEVESAEGAGSTFTVRFPRLAPAEGAVRAEPGKGEETPEKSDSPSGRVLVVEDNPNTRSLTEHLLRDAGYAVTPVAGAEEALAAVEERGAPPFDVFLIDIDLGGGGEDGVGLLHRLRARRGSRAAGGAPAVAFTAHAAGEEHYRDIGFDGYLGKPFSKEDLLGVVGGAPALGA